MAEQIKCFLGLLNHTPLEKMYEHKQDNTCLNILEKEGEIWKAHLINYTKHLEKSK